MSLIKEPSMSEKNRAAHQRNGRQSRGAATAEGKERSRAANLRHGFYSREREKALRALGEDPAELAALLGGHARAMAARQRFSGAPGRTSGAPAVAHGARRAHAGKPGGAANATV